MKIIDQVAKRLGYVQKSTDYFPQDMSVSNGMDISSDKSIAEQFGQIFTDIDIISTTCASIEPTFVRKSDRTKEVTDHWLKTILNNPNSSMSPFKFRSTIFGHKLVHPNVFIKLERTAKRIPYGLTIPLPSSITMETYTGELVYKNNSNNTVIPSDQIINIFGFNPISNIDGYSPLQSIKEFLSLEDLMMYYQQAYYRNGSLPGGFVFVRGTEADAQAVRNTLTRTFKGVGNANRIAVIAQPKTDVVDPVKFFVPELQKQVTTPELYDNIQKLKSKSFRVPDEIKGIVSNSTYASARVAQDIFMRNTVKPHLDQVYDEINHYISVNFPNEDIYIETDISPMLPSNYDDLAVQIDSAVKLVNAGFSPHSVLTALDLPDMEYTGIAVQQTIEPKKTANKAKLKEVTTDGGDIIEEANTDKYINKTEKTIQEFLKAQQVRVLKLLTKKKAINDIGELDIDAETADIVASIVPIMLAVTNNAGKMATTQAKIELKDIVEASAIPDFKLDTATKTALVEYFDKVFRNFNTETSDQLKAIMQNAIDNNLTVGEVAKNIKTYYADSEYRSARVARTEVIRTYNKTNTGVADTIADDNQLTYTKTWKTLSGEPCEFCLSLEGTEVSRGEAFVPNGKSLDGVNGGSFTNDWEDVEDGNLHPHCQCTIVKTWEVI
jgi:HK97 family phage portal protein